MTHLNQSFKHFCALGVRSVSEFVTPAVTTESSVEAYELVLDGAGCFPRDLVTRRTVEEVRSGGGAWGKREPADLMEGLSARPAPQDTDRDGMADQWEAANGLDSSNGDDHSHVMDSGYTAIEEYCNGLAAVLLR
jgi:hypothetical protein